MIGLSGAHRSGKTTLAKRVADTLGLTYCEVSVSKIARDLGVNAVGDLPIAERIAFQRRLLPLFIKEIRKTARPCIVDRTPLDMIGYMLGEITMHNTSAEVGTEVYTYVEECLKATADNFDLVLVLRPLQAFVVDPKSPPMNPAYQWLIQYIIEGAISNMNTDHTTTALIHGSDLDVRLDAVAELLRDRLEYLTNESKTYTHQ